MPRGNPNWSKGGAEYRPPGGEGMGAGWGGAAKGDAAMAEPFTADNQPPPEAKAAGHAEAETLRQMLSPHKRAVADTWLGIMNDPLQPAAARNVAAEKVALYGGTPQPSTNLAGPGGEPLPSSIAIRFVKPDAI